MKVEEITLPGAYVISPDRKEDHRGYFARTYCSDVFKNNGLQSTFLQMSTSFNCSKGQIRGMHFQDEPYGEVKVVRCTKGAVLDVILDLRKDSPTYNNWYSLTLSQDNGISIYIPRGFAHGYKTLQDSTELFYMMDQKYMPEFAREVAFKEEYLS